MHLLNITSVTDGVTTVLHLAEEGRWEEGFALLDRLDALTDDRDERARLTLARVALISELDWNRGLRDPEIKHRLLDEVADVAVGRLPELEAALHFERGMALHLEFIMSTGDTDRELASFTRAAEIYESIGDIEGAALSIAFIGIFHHVDRLDRDAAYPVLERAYKMAPAGRGSAARAEAARHMGQIHQERGEYAEAIRLLAEALAARAEAGDTKHLPSALHALGYAHLEAGNLDLAEDYLSRARLLGDRFNSRLFLPMIAKAEAELALQRVIGANTRGRSHP